MDRERLIEEYSSLCGLRDAVASEKWTTLESCLDFNKAVKEIGQLTNRDDLNNHQVPLKGSYNFDRAVPALALRTKLLPFLSFLERTYQLNDRIVEIGSVYNSIKDKELKERCADLLSATSNFDRVINQATLVLENRIRTRAGRPASEVGGKLVSAAITSDPTKSILKLSDDANEQEGIAHICRGIVLAYRNPTHHRVVEGITRERALKICAFVDELLMLIDAAQR